MSRKNPRSTTSPQERPKKKSSDDRARVVVDQCPHRITGVMHIPGLQLHAPEHESMLERPVIQLLAMCNDISAIESQPESVVFVDGEGKQRKYTTDLLITTTANEQIRVEVKPLVYALSGKTYDDLLSIAQHYADKQQQFEIVTDDAVDIQPRLSIAKALRLYLTSPVDAETRDAIITILDTGPRSIRQLLVELDGDHHLRDIYALIAQRQICIPWNEPFGRDMYVSLPNQPYPHLTYVSIANSGRFRAPIQELALGRRPTDQRLLAAALAKDQSVSLPAAVGNIGGLSGRALQVGRNFRMARAGGDGSGQPPETGSSASSCFWAR